MRICFEGVNGVGKTTIAKIIAQRLGYKYIGKNEYVLLDEEGRKLLSRTIAPKDKEVKTAIYGLRLLFLNHIIGKDNVVIDRFIVSEYSWNYSDETKAMFEYFMKRCGVPDLTIILHASNEIRIKRIFDRANNQFINHDFLKSEGEFSRILECVNKYNMPYLFVDNTDMELDETASFICEYIQKFKTKNSF